LPAQAPDIQDTMTVTSTMTIAAGSLDATPFSLQQQQQRDIFVGEAGTAWRTLNINQHRDFHLRGTQPSIPEAIALQRRL